MGSPVGDRLTLFLISGNLSTTSVIFQPRRLFKWRLKLVKTCKAVWKIPDLSRLFLSLGKWEIVSVAEIFEFTNFGGWICYWRPVLNPEVSTSYLVVGRSLILKILEKLCGISPGGSSDTFSSFRKTVTHVRVSPTSEVAIKDFGKMPEFLWLSFSRQGFESR